MPTFDITELVTTDNEPKMQTPMIIEKKTEDAPKRLEKKDQI